MPKVTLLAERYEDYTLHFGSGSFEFIGGQPKDVPVAVAIHCSKQMTTDGKCKFLIEEMPEVVECAPPVEDQATAEQNVMIARQQLFSQPKLYESAICL